MINQQSWPCIVPMTLLDVTHYFRDLSSLVLTNCQSIYMYVVSNYWICQSLHFIFACTSNNCRCLSLKAVYGKLFILLGSIRRTFSSWNEALCLRQCDGYFLHILIAVVSSHDTEPFFDRCIWLSLSVIWDSTTFSPAMNTKLCLQFVHNNVLEQCHNKFITSVWLSNVECLWCIYWTRSDSFCDLFYYYIRK